MEHKKSAYRAKIPDLRREKVHILPTFKKCRNMSYLTTRIFNFFRLNGYPLVQKPFDADTVVIVACGFDQTREQAALKAIGARGKPFIGYKKVIIAGCLAGISKELSETGGLVLIGPQELDKFDSLFKARIPIKNVLANKFKAGVYNDPSFNPEEYYIEIGRGCVNNCSYCVIKKATGRVRSKPIAGVLSEFRTGLSLGFKKFVLLADDCGSYGADIGTDFAQLLNRIYGLKKHDFGLNIHYFEPGTLARLFPKIDKGVFSRVYFINIPMQTASQRILRLMNRKYDIKEVLGIVKKIKALNTKTTLITHILYCFPTETMEEFRRSVRMGGYFDEAKYFYYSPRNGTRARDLKGQIPEKEKKYRTAMLLAKSIKTDNITIGYDKQEIIPMLLGGQKAFR